MTYSAGYVAGSKVRASSLNDDFAFVAPIIVRKTVDENVTNSTTYQDDDELLASVEANAVYACWLKITYASPATADFKIYGSWPTGATAPDWHYTHDGGSGVGNATLGLTGIPGTAAGTKDPFDWHGLLIVGATAGTVQWKWAQFTADVGTTTVYAGSYFVLQRLS